MRTPAIIAVLLFSFFNLSSALAIDIDLALDTNSLFSMSSVPVPPEIAQIVTTKKLQYCRFVDTHQWSNFSAKVALPECTYEYTDHGELIVVEGFAYQWNTTADFLSYFSETFETLQTIHHIGPGEFTFVNLNKVSVIFPIVYHSALAVGANSTRGVTGTGGGHYYEEYTRKGTDWFMSKCTMDQLYYQAPSATNTE